MGKRKLGGSQDVWRMIPVSFAAGVTAVRLILVIDEAECGKHHDNDHESGH
jgi:hypothetical protein